MFIKENVIHAYRVSNSLSFKITVFHYPHVIPFDCLGMNHERFKCHLLRLIR